MVVVVMVGCAGGVGPREPSALMTEKGILEDGGCTNLVAYTLDAWGREQERIEL